IERLLTRVVRVEFVACVDQSFCHRQADFSDADESKFAGNASFRCLGVHMVNREEQERWTARMILLLACTCQGFIICTHPSHGRQQCTPVRARSYPERKVSKGPSRS